MKPIIFFTNNTQIIQDLDYFFDGLGFVGGIILSGCLIPQLIKAVRTKSAKDISYLWQVLSLVGLFLTFIYGIYFLLYPVFIPLILEMSLMLALTILKLNYEFCKAKDSVENP